MTNEKIEKANSYFIQAQEASYNRNYKKAKEYYEKAIKLNPKFAEAYNNLAVLLFQYFKEYKTAKEYYEKAIKFKNKYSQAYFNLGNLLQHSYFKKYKEAKECYEKAIEFNPKFVEAYSLLSNLLLHHFKDSKKSIEYLEKGINQMPDIGKIKAEFYNMLAISFQLKKEYEKARENYEKAIKINPDIAEFYYGLAIVFHEIKEYEKAKENYEKAIEINPNLIQAKKNLIQLEKSNLIQSENNPIPTFINHLKIKQVRHLKDIDIPLDEKEMKHLIFTGDNGSGKTSVLEEIKNYLKHITEGVNINTVLSANLQNPLQPSDRNIDIHFKEKVSDLRFKWDTGNFLLAYFKAHRKFKGETYTFQTSEAKSKLPQRQGIEARLAQNYFMPFTVFNKFQSMLLKEQGDNNKNEHFNKWFGNLQNILRTVYDDDSLEINFQQVVEKMGFNIEIKTKERNTFNFEELTDGFASILEIIFELILRMYNKTQDLYIMEGIVLIDEPEAHLHIKMQKRLLPLLTELFPKIQFIVASHSPFILNSLENAVVYDLQNRTLGQNFSAYSYSGLVETHFESDKYSEKIKQKFEEYKTLVEKDNWTEDEEIILDDLEDFFEELPSSVAVELKVAFQDLQLQRIAKEDD